MADYSDDIAAAQAVIADAGELTTWTRYNNGVPVVVKNISMVFFPDTQRGYAFLAQKPSEPVPSGMKLAIMGAIPFEPTLKDTVKRTSGQTLRVNTVNELDPNGQIVIYILRLQR